MASPRLPAGLSASSEKAPAQLRIVGNVYEDMTFRFIDPDFKSDGRHVKKSNTQISEDKRKRRREEITPSTEEGEDEAEAAAAPKPKLKRGPASSPIAEAFSDTNAAVNAIIDKMRLNMTTISMMSKRCSAHAAMIKRGTIGQKSQFQIGQEERDAMLGVDNFINIVGNYKDSCAVGFSLGKFGGETRWEGWHPESKKWLEDVYLTPSQSAPQTTPDEQDGS